MHLEFIHMHTCVCVCLCFRLSLVRENKPGTLSCVFPPWNLKIVFYFFRQDVNRKQYFLPIDPDRFDFFGKIPNRIVNNQKFFRKLRQRVRVRLSAVIPRKNMSDGRKSMDRKAQLFTSIVKSVDDDDIFCSENDICQTLRDCLPYALHYRPIVHRRHP